MSQSICTISRKIDGKIFGCYFRNCSVQLIPNSNADDYSAWISKSDKEELEISGGINPEIYFVVEVYDEDSKKKIPVNEHLQSLLETILKKGN